MLKTLKMVKSSLVITLLKQSSQFLKLLVELKMSQKIIVLKILTNSSNNPKIMFPTSHTSYSNNYLKYQTNSEPSQ